MKNRKNWGRAILLIALCLMFLSGCNTENAKQELTGKWLSSNSGQVIEFTADGHYIGIQDKNYTFEVIDGKQLKIVNPEYTDGSDSILMDFTLTGDELTTVYNGESILWKRQ